MILQLDLGNSRIKWRLIEKEFALETASGAVLSWPQLLGLQQFADPAQVPDRVQIASVRNQQQCLEVQEWVRSNWELQAEVATVRRYCGPLSNSYQDPGRMGVDRWLALLAAFHRQNGACVVVDCGTALTLDAVDGSGNHLGGYIVPGLKTMRDSLVRNTSIKLASGAVRDDIALGHSTDEAVNNGTLATLLALIEKKTAEFTTIEGQEIGLLLTGGDAGVFKHLLRIENCTIEVIPNLVLDGLSIMFIDSNSDGK